MVTDSGFEVSNNMINDLLYYMSNSNAPESTTTVTQATNVGDRCTHPISERQVITQTSNWKA